MAGYKRIVSDLKVQFKLESLPSFYKLTKNRPKMCDLNIEPLAPLDTGKINESSLSLLSVIGTDFDEEQALMSTGDGGAILTGGKIDGSYCSYVKMMASKHKDYDRRIMEDADVIVIDLFDGAKHSKSNTKRTSLISFSSQLFTPQMINLGKVTCGSSLNILTWQQINGTESYSNMMPAVKEYFESKGKLYSKTDTIPFLKKSRISYYDLHDGKMLYLLTQHSLWNRKHHPFLLCDCKRGDGVKNRHHQCKLMSDADYLKYYNRSNRRWMLKRKREGVEKYTNANHSNWIDEKNLGVSHFGIHPKLLPLSNIRFDTFHMKCSITRKLMTSLRRFILNQSTLIMKKFSALLREIWSDFLLFVWRNNKAFTSFNGNELKNSFITYQK